MKETINGIIKSLETSNNEIYEVKNTNNRWF